MTDVKENSLPLRGLAMVLIAVAVILGLWALYSFTRDDAPAPATVASGTAPADAVSGAPAAGAPAQGAPAAGTPAGTADAAVAPAGGAAEGAAEGADAAPAGAAVPAGSGAPAAAASGQPKRVNVLNNSTIAGLAADMAAQIEADGFELGEVGNFATDILPETTVFFPAGDAAAEAQARELAEKLRGVARENIDSLPDSADQSVTVVLVNS